MLWHKEGSLSLEAIGAKRLTFPQVQETRKISTTFSKFSVVFLGRGGSRGGCVQCLREALILNSGMFYQ